MQGEILGGGYRPPVDRLLTVGDPRTLDHPSPESPGWPDYRRYGLGPADVPDLIRLAGDEVFNEGDPESREVWAPLHAWRALGQLRAVDAVAPLLDLLSEADEDDDGVREELPEVFGLIGPEAIPALAAYLADTADTAQDLTNRITITSAFAKMGLRHPNVRAECVRALSRQLEGFKDNDPELNGFIIASLLDLKAVEAAPLMQQAFESGRVDLIVVGDWDTVRVELGLLPARIQITQPPPEGSRSPLARRFGLPPIPPYSPLTGPLGPLLTDEKQDKADKAKRKAADKSRKRNKKRT